MKSDNYCVIMAGGIGSRFWPLSRTARPKQFLDILGNGKSFLQQTYDRFNKIIPAENILIVTNSNYGSLVFEQLPNIPKENVLLEPLRRNTAPCIAYASYKILSRNENARVVVAPSDHLIENENQFLDVVDSGLNFVGDYDALLTLGIRPSRPETGYGYIQINNEQIFDGRYQSFNKIKTFTEKPDLKLARVFLESGDFSWNSGIFFWSLKTIRAAFIKYLPEIDSLFNEGLSLYGTPSESYFILKTYPQCRNISIDYGIMEKADNVYVLISDFGWSDIGTWGSLYEHQGKDESGNSISGSNVFPYKLQNCIVKFPEDKIVILEGLRNYIVVESDNMLLVCRKQQEQNIKQFLNEVMLKKGDEFL
jgi:mannose-1-phosphate guanylyltransferase